MLKPQATKKGIELILDLAGSLPSADYVLGDPNRMRQVIANLVGNAVKFTERGYVRLAVSVYDEQGLRLRMTVEDTGMGIPEDKLDSIFEKFTQADSSITRKYGGSGLGLAITHQLITLMGGCMGVESALGKGSTFWFELPLTPADATAVAEIETGSFCSTAVTRMPSSEARVLLVEDYPVNQVFAERLLRKFGFVHIDTAINGREAIDAYRARHYDAIFMDCQMPEIDGYQATQTIRHLEADGTRHTPIIAMTANAMMGDREKCLKAGMDDYTSKPLKPDHLKAILHGWFIFEAPPTQQAKYEAALNFYVGEPTVNMQQLQLFTDGDKAEEQELATLYLDQARMLVVAMEASSCDGLAAEWKAAAHRLKGASGNLGAVRMHLLCEKAERHTNADQSHKQDILRAMTIELKNIEQFFQLAPA
jgi:CheY-like chemotaxis protein/anti-sigma regulatory factor (Ser/Thr protein kinase)